MGKAEDVRRMFADIHPTYDFLNHLLAFGRDRAWRRRMARAAAPRAGDVILDLCAGTCDSTMDFAGHQGLIVAADFTPEMLAIGAKKLKACAMPAATMVADAQTLPLAGQSVDVVTVAFGMRNLADLDRGIAEIARVMRPGGRLAILELARSRRIFSRMLDRIYCGICLPIVGRMVSGHSSAYRYLPASVQSYPTREVVSQKLAASGFEQVQVEAMNFDLVTLHLAVRKRELV